MSAPAAREGFDPERTRLDPSGGVRAPGLGQLGRGSILAGKYRLELLLGAGGMGFVWSAYHLELQLPVAIKLLKSGANNERLAARLRLEARTAACLVHPTIVRVFDMGVAENGDPFIVMELLTGENLAAVLARGRLSGVRAVQLLLPVAEALVLAHARGIVHRDLKPANVFLSKDGQLVQPKLLDFGIAKLSHASALVGKLTDKGTVLGSPSYMSPEQVRGDEVDYRSDIWSFCVVLYKAVMGTAPFRGADELAIMKAIMTDEPAPLACVDEQLARLIQRGLAKDPARRPTSMRELGRELSQWLLAQGVSEDACGTPLATKWASHGAHPNQHGPLPRRHHWALLTAASMLIVSGSVAQTDSFRSASAHAAKAAPITNPQSPATLPISVTHTVLAASPKSASGADPVAVAAASPAQQRRAIRPNGSPSRPRRVPISQLPF